jgi:hypothetical protein
MSIVRDDKNWLLVFENSARRGFLALASNRKAVIVPREDESLTKLVYVVRWLIHQLGYFQFGVPYANTMVFCTAHSYWFRYETFFAVFWSFWTRVACFPHH